MTATGCCVAVGTCLLAWAAMAAHWLVCRLTAQRCPKCGAKWHTELQGEWGGELWYCHKCNHPWEVPYR